MQPTESQVRPDEPGERKVPGEPVIELSNVSKSFGSVRALGPLDFTLRRGETTVLIGSSGSGKSTALRLMIGLITPDRGEVRFDRVSFEPDTSLALRRRMGYVIQDGGLFPHLSARDNVELMARQLGRPPSEREARIAALAELTSFPREALDRFPAQLSGGQRQRVSLMRALMLEPEVLLLDEPLAALDPMIRAELQRDLRAIFRRLDKTVVLVTHDMGEAAYLGDRIVLLREGIVVQDGSLQELLEKPAEPFVTQFINAQRSPLGRAGLEEAE